jgi:polyhydroxybutyrate depolymerase
MRSVSIAAMVMAIAIVCAAASAASAQVERKALVLLLHPYGMTGNWVAWYFKTAALAAQAVVLAPTASLDAAGKHAWNASQACCNPSVPDDVSVLSALVEARLAQGDVDPARVYVWGYSNGAFMAWRLACERADLFRSAVMLAGAASAPGDPPCVPSRPVDILHVHGTADETVPYRRPGHTMNMSSDFPAVLDGSLSQEARAMGCRGPWVLARVLAFDHDLLAPGPETDVLRATDCAARVEHWAMAGTAHVPLLAREWPARLLAWSEGRALP